MNNDFVPYQESLELKNLGFDEPCLYHWHKSCKTYPFTNEIFNPNCKPKTNSGIKDIGDENHVWSAPTFSQAFRWFRKQYKLSGTPQYFTREYYCYTINDMKDTEESNKLFTEFETYEEAELACLRKLIQIVKDKQ